MSAGTFKPGDTVTHVTYGAVYTVVGRNPANGYVVVVTGGGLPYSFHSDHIAKFQQPVVFVGFDPVSVTEKTAEFNVYLSSPSSKETARWKSFTVVYKDGSSQTVSSSWVLEFVQ
jgi:hypothetical protein